MKRPLTALALVLALGMSLSGCAEYTTTGVPTEETAAAEPATESLAPDQDPLVGTSWALESSTVEGLAAFPITASFTEGIMTGQGPVNSYTAPYEVQADTEIEIGPVATTKMAGDPEAMQAEAEFLQLLDEVSGFVVSDVQLQLIADSEPVLVFGPAEATPAADGSGEEPATDAEAAVVALAETLVGMPLAEAEAAVEEAGYTVRVLSVDGEAGPATSDFRTDRINLVVVDDEVTQATVG